MEWIRGNPLRILATSRQPRFATVLESGVGPMIKSLVGCSDFTKVLAREYTLSSSALVRAKSQTKSIFRPDKSISQNDPRLPKRRSFWSREHHSSKSGERPRLVVLASTDSERVRIQTSASFGCKAKTFRRPHLCILSCRQMQVGRIKRIPGKKEANYVLVFVRRKTVRQPE